MQPEVLEGEPVNVQLLTLHIVGPVSGPGLRFHHTRGRDLPAPPDPNEVAAAALEDGIVELFLGEHLGRALEVSAQPLHR